MGDRQSEILRCRAANRILKYLERRPNPESCDGSVFLITRVHQIQAELRRWAVCQKRGWEIAADSVLQQIRRMLDDVREAADTFDRTVRQHDHPQPTLRNLVADLKQLETEFDAVRYTTESLCAITDPIHLDDVYLGPFEIQLKFSSLAEPDCSSAYRVVALDAYPAASHHSVTHPHIQDTVLCEGDAVPAIRQALTDGRVCDFFVLVRSVLQTYNPHSAYVSLDDWSGVSCGGCDEFIAANDCYCCVNCDVDRCFDCIVFCKACDDPFCSGCVVACGGCSASLCSECTQACPGCDEVACAECHENHCLHEEECDDPQSETHETIAAPTSDAGAAVCA